MERAKVLLDRCKPLLEVSDSLGLSSGSRLYDHFVCLEAVTPGEYKMAGKGLTIEYAVQDSPFGKVFIATTDRGISNFSFLEAANIDEPLTNLYKRWPYAMVIENKKRAQLIVEAIFGRFC